MEVALNCFSLRLPHSHVWFVKILKVRTKKCYDHKILLPITKSGGDMTSVKNLKFKYFLS